MRAISETITGIMQPTFLPWIGYFAMMDRAQHFVFLDSVQFAKRSWQQRNQIKTASGAQWLTISVLSKGLREQLIADVRIDHSSECIEKTIKTLTASYSKAPYFKEYSEPLFRILQKKHEFLADLNIEFICEIARILGINTEFIRSSQMGVEGRKADLLATIAEKLKTTTYISALGSKDYLDESTAFAERNIKICFNHYEHPQYPQLHGEFVPYMCVLDLIFNVGPKSLEMIRSGCRDGMV